MRRKVAAAKSYIEHMYKVQHQNIQERYARWVGCWWGKAVQGAQAVGVDLSLRGVTPQ